MRLGMVAVLLVACEGGSGSEDAAAVKDAPAAPAKRDRVVLQNKGSDTMVNVAQAWAEAYQTVDPQTVIAVTGGGSGTGISALINGTVDLANSSREMKDEEVAQAKEKGHEPVKHVVGHDALGIFLHKDNPITEMTLEQLAGIYGDGGTTVKWSQLGVKVPGCDSDEIILVSRQNNSGTYEYFKEHVLAKKDFKLGTKDMHGSKDVTDLVGKRPCAIGYSGLAYVTPEVKMPCIKKAADQACVAPTSAAALDGTYPIARPLFIYTSGEAKDRTKEYLDWIVSDAGQCVLQDIGYAAIRTVTCPPK
jgi:phosphate transport system substrate-binding protein